MSTRLHHLVFIAVVFVLLAGCSGGNAAVNPSGNAEVVARFTHSAPDGYVVSNAVLFDASESSSTYFKITEYKWDWGDGSDPVAYDVPTAFHIFKNKNDFNVKLTVTDQVGTSAVSAQVVGINPAGSAPVVKLSYNASEGWQPDSLFRFDASASYDPDGDQLTYSWDFGSGTFTDPSNSPATTNIFNTSGEIPVRVKVTDATGWSTVSDPLRLSLGIPEGAKLVKNIRFGDTHRYVVIDARVIGDYLYAAFGNAGMAVMDITNPADPEVLGMFPDIKVDSMKPDCDRFITNSGDVISLTDPFNPVYIGHLQIPNLSNVTWFKHGDYVYVLRRLVDDESKIQVYEASDFENPVLLNEVYFDRLITNIRMTGGFLIASGSEDIYFFTVNNPTEFVQVMQFGDFGEQYLSVAIVGDYVYATTYVDKYTNNLLLFNISNLEHPSFDRSIQIPWGGSILLEGNRMVIAGGRFYIFDISDPAHPIGLSSTTTADDMLGYDLWEDYIYVAEGFGGFSVFDLTNSRKPIKVSNFRDNGFVQNQPYLDCIISNNLAFITTQMPSLQVIDISNLNFPIMLAELELPTSCYRLVLHGSNLFGLGQNGSILVVDIADPENPIAINSVQAPDILDFAIQDNYLYATGRDPSSLVIYDISDTMDIAKVSSMSLFEYCKSIALKDNMVFMGASTDPDYLDWSIYTVDVTDPELPVLVSTFPLVDKWHGIQDLGISGDALACILDIRPGDWMGEPFHLRMVDISDPLNQSILNDFEFRKHAGAIKIYGDYGFFREKGLFMTDLSDPSNPAIQAYLPSEGGGCFAVEADVALVANYDQNTQEYWFDAYKLW